MQDRIAEPPQMSAPGYISLRGPLSPAQFAVVAICISLNMLDGFDVQVMAYIASAVTHEWALSGTRLGLLISAGLIGMGTGAMFVAPLADILGRRPLLIVCTGLAGLLTFRCGFVETYGELALLRFATGVCVGVLLVCAAVLAAEVVEGRWKSTVIALNSVGYQLGAVVGGVGSNALLTHYGWRAPFFIGTAMGALLLPALLLWLLESIEFLLARQPRDALRRINHILQRLKKEPLTSSPWRLARAPTPGCWNQFPGTCRSVVVFGSHSF